MTWIVVIPLALLVIVVAAVAFLWIHLPNLTLRSQPDVWKRVEVSDRDIVRYPGPLHDFSPFLIGTGALSAWKLRRWYDPERQVTVFEFVTEKGRELG